MPDVVKNLPGEEEEEPQDEGSAFEIETEEESDSSKEPAGVVLTPEQFAQMQAKIAEAGTTKEIVSTLAEKLATPANAPPDMSQGPMETDEQYRERVEAMLFDKGKAVDAISEVVRRAAGPAFQQLLGDLSVRERKQIAKDPEKPYFSKYEKEIERYVSELPVSQRSLPGVWERAYDAVLMRHQRDVISEEIARGVEEELKKRGIGPQQKPKATVQGGGSPMPSGAPARQKIKVTAEELQRLKRAALERGMDEEEYIRMEKGTR